MKLLPIWLAPNMVTLLGFFAILSNVICLVVFMPDLVGPVRRDFLVELAGLKLMWYLHIRGRRGYITASRSAYGRTLQWIILMASRLDELEHPAVWENSLTTALIP